MKQTEIGGKHILPKKVAASFLAYGEAQGWKMDTTPYGNMFEVRRWNVQSDRIPGHKEEPQ